jgi:probable rRNA maturation factor
MGRGWSWQERMEIQTIWRMRLPGLETRKVKRKLNKILKVMGCSEMELSVLFTDDREIATLNHRYLGRKGATDVLSFPMAGGAEPSPVTSMLGDVVISLETAFKEADEMGISVTEMVDRLLIHGILHLLGFDHETSAGDAEKMEREESRLLHLIGG